MQGIFGAEHPCGAVLGATARASRSESVGSSAFASTTEPKTLVTRVTKLTTLALSGAAGSFPATEPFSANAAKCTSRSAAIRTAALPWALPATALASSSAFATNAAPVLSAAKPTASEPINSSARPFFTTPTPRDATDILCATATFPDLAIACSEPSAAATALTQSATTVEPATPEITGAIHSSVVSKPFRSATSKHATSKHATSSATTDGTTDAVVAAARVATRRSSTATSATNLPRGGGH